MMADRIARRSPKGHIMRLILSIALSGLFWFAWLLFVIGYYSLFQTTASLSVEMRRIVIAVLGLFGALNVMMLSAFFLIVIRQRTKSRLEANEDRE